MTHREIAQAAIELLTKPENGWCKGEYTIPNNRGGADYCIVGACSTPFGYNINGQPAGNAGYVVAGLAVRSMGYEGPVSWNDKVANSIEEVIAALETVK